MDHRAQREDITTTYATRALVTIHGAVQGVGFRPFVYRLATEYGLSGWVTNTPQGVIIEAEGPTDKVSAFLLCIPTRKPPLSRIHSMETRYLDAVGHHAFEIRESKTTGTASAVILPDIATCTDCLHELFDPKDRRYRYPFINCTHCGPRFTIIDALPYDRPNTSMRTFIQCSACLSEYTDPSDRRFHAQPNACPTCGPSVEVWDRHGNVLGREEEAIQFVLHHLHAGSIVAVKGIGGFHLMCDATNAPVVHELRRRKRREEKPLALMVPSLEYARSLALFSPEEEQLLASPESPIVLVRRRASSASLNDAVPGENPYLGLMLPYTPVHHLIMHELNVPLVATSGNLSEEPICIDEHEAIVRLGRVADFFLVHNRPIRRHVDDSIVRIVRGREQVLRRARGYAPLPVMTKHTVRPTIAVGAHLKNTIAVSSGNRIITSQHIGDLETAESMNVFRSVLGDIPGLHDINAEAVACDLHPDYLSTKYADNLALPKIRVQHHAAHVYACMAENELEPPVLGVSWDGTGLGTDGTVWGGEFIVIDESSWKRVGHLRSFLLPGGDAAIKEPRRCGLALLFELAGDSIDAFRDVPTMKAFSENEKQPLYRMMMNRLNTPLTSSAGRLFDGIASLLGVRQTVRHEGQAAMNLEWLSTGVRTPRHYRMPVVDDAGGVIVDWRPMVTQIVADLREGVSVHTIARGFHNALAEAICGVARRVGIAHIALTGGCFQNLLLSELTADLLEMNGFRVYLHQRIPPNDGGIAVGQAYAASCTPYTTRAIEEEHNTV